VAFVPNVNWTNDEPPGFEADDVIRMQLGIADAASVAATASSTADQALSDAAAAQSTADEALAAVGSGGVHTVDDDVKRIYSADTFPPDGYKAGDLLVSAAPSAQGPSAIPGLLYWLDAAATGAKDLGVALPDVSGNGNHIAWRDLSGQTPAGIGVLNGLPAFQFATSRYWWSRTFPGEHTISGVARFDGTQSGDMPLFYTGSTDSIHLGVRSNGDLYCTVGSTTVWEGPLAWSSEGRAHLSFVLSLSTNATLWISGVQMASVAVTGGGTHGTLAVSAGSGEFFAGPLGEFAEHEGHAAASAEAAALAEYYRQKWRV